VLVLIKIENRQQEGVMKQKAVLTTDQVREKLVQLSGYRITEDNAIDVINALRSIDVTIDDESLGILAEIKRRFRNFKWSNTVRVFKTATKFKNVQAMNIRDLKITLRGEGNQTAKISKLLKLSGVSKTPRTELIPAKTCLTILIRSALFDNKPYSPK
jgi:hypothetical protein